MRRMSSVAVIAAAGLIVALGSGLALPKPEPTRVVVSAPETFTVDAVHSSVVFRIGHLGVSNFWGRFTGLSGEFTFDESNPTSATFNFTVKTDSVDSGNEQRDRHLENPDFFNAREHPEITFKSTKVASAADGTLEVTGDLSLHGVTKPVTAKIEMIGAAETRQGYKRGFEATLDIKRSDFGMTTYLEGNALGDEVRVIVAVEGARG